jgi:hypothetical protein
MILLSSTVQTMGLGALGGLTAFGREIPRGRDREQEGEQRPADASGEPTS